MAELLQITLGDLAVCEASLDDDQMQKSRRLVEIRRSRKTTRFEGDAEAWRSLAEEFDERAGTGAEGYDNEPSGKRASKRAAQKIRAALGKRSHG